MCPWEPDSPGNEPYRNGFCLNNRHANHPCCADACDLLSQWDPAQNELNYAQQLQYAAKGELGMDAHVIIDTGRNGVPDARSDCSHWCNNRGSGAGHASTAQTQDTSIVDAYFYLKTPGESDGCTETLADGSACPRFDEGCGSSDALGNDGDEPPAPEAGVWFDYQVKQLAEFADFGGSSPASAPARARGPSPAPVPPPAPPSSSGSDGSEGRCCWGTACDAEHHGNCAAPSAWCSKSRDQCTGACAGIWCSASEVALASTGIVSTPRKVRRQGFLHAAETLFFQKKRALHRVGTKQRKSDEL